MKRLLYILVCALTSTAASGMVVEESATTIPVVFRWYRAAQILAWKTIYITMGDSLEEALNQLRALGLITPEANIRLMHDGTVIAPDTWGDYSDHAIQRNGQGEIVFTDLHLDPITAQDPINIQFN